MSTLGLKRLALGIISGALSLAVVSPAEAALTLSCQKNVASQASSMYKFAAKQFSACGKKIAGGSLCSTAIRDAKVSGKLAKARSKITVKCDGHNTASVGFGSSGDLAVQAAGRANGEGRWISDSVYGREPGVLSTDDKKCAAAITSQSAKAGKVMIKKLIACGNSCSAVDQTKVDDAWTKAEAKANAKCGAGSLAVLVAGDLSAHMLAMRAGAQRVVDGAVAAPLPVVSVVDPSPGTIITPAGVPFDVDVVGTVANVPHAGYVNSFEIEGVEANFDTVASEYDRTISISSPGGTNLSFFLEARTVLGTISTTASANLNLGTLAPDVVITSPSSGTITPSSPVTVGGQVIGDLSEADILLVDGISTPFDPVTGLWSTSVGLGAGSVHIVEADVQSVGLGTSNKDSIVVLEGTALPLNQRVPDGNHNRLNNTGFTAVTSLIQGQLDAAFDPALLIGQPAAGGTICAFSIGTTSASIFGAGPTAVQADIGIANFHMEVCDVDTGFLGITCDATYDANQVDISTQADLVGQLEIGTTSSNVTFTGSSASLSGNIICDFVDLFLADLEADMEVELADQLEAQLPAAFDEALAGINVSGPIGQALDVEIDALYTDIPEDSNGVTFILDSNISALDPVPDAPNITETLVPSGAGTPVLGPFIPSTSTPYDLGFCLSDGFVNRAMAAFMLQGMFNQSLQEILPGVFLTTTVVGGLTLDPAWNAACPGCDVTLVLKPTSAAVARAPQGGEDGTVVLVVPNYQLEMVADDGGNPLSLYTALVTFDLPLTLDVASGQIEPVIGTLALSNFKTIDNPIGANAPAFEAAAGDLFPLAAAGLGGLFGVIPLPPFQGLELNGVGADYNSSCTAIYMSLS